MRGLSGGVVKRDVGDNGGNNAGDISDLRNSMEIMMENINHLVTKQQVGNLDCNFSSQRALFVFERATRKHARKIRLANALLQFSISLGRDITVGETLVQTLTCQLLSCLMQRLSGGY